jgi:hypothetical protein
MLNITLHPPREEGGTLRGPKPETWLDQALCGRTDPDVFFNRSTAAARRLCAACPVNECCFWWAMSTEAELGERIGVWAGTTAAQRARIAKAFADWDSYPQSRYAQAVTEWGSARVVA